MKKLLFLGLLLAGGCAVPGPTPTNTVSSPNVTSNLPSSAGSKHLFIYAPLNEEGIAAALTLLEKDQNLRFVLALSPRFQKLAQDNEFKTRLQRLESQGQVELALQIPNAPLLPLLANSDSAKIRSPGAALPTPAYSWPEDVAQVISQSRAQWHKLFGRAPRGVVLPYGAASLEVIQQVQRLNFSWVVGALELPSQPGPYLLERLEVFDGTPSSAGPFTVDVLDERLSEPARSLKILESWSKRGHSDAMLPVGGFSGAPLPDGVPLGGRTWTQPDWSAWIGSPRKNAAWNWLRRTRADLEMYQNSGRAAVKSLDLASQELYTAQNANHFYWIGRPTPAGDERENEFKASLANVYRLIGKNPPSDLFSADIKSTGTATSAHITIEGEGLVIEDAIETPEGHPSRAADLKLLRVSSTPEFVRFEVELAAAPAAGQAPTVDVYIDLNHAKNVGTLSFLPGRDLAAAAFDAWEFAFTVQGSQALLYRTRPGATSELAEKLPAVWSAGQVHVDIPRALLRGSPLRWGYQALVGTAPNFDVFDTAGTEESGRSEVTFVRVAP